VLVPSKEVAAVLKDARDLTERIKLTAGNLADMLWEARGKKVWATLDYPSWNAYIDAEFDFQKAYANRLVRQAKTNYELAVAAQVDPIGSTAPTLPEGAARELRPVLSGVTADIRSQVEAGVEPVAAVEAAVERGRQAVKSDDTAIVEHVHSWVCSVCGEGNEVGTAAHETPVLDDVSNDRWPNTVFGARRIGFVNVVVTRRPTRNFS